MHKISFETMVWQESYQSVNIKDNILLFPVQRTAVTQWCFDAIIKTVNVVFSANDHILIQVSGMRKDTVLKKTHRGISQQTVGT